MLCDSCSIAISDILACDLDSSRWRVEPFAPEARVFSLGDNRKIVENASRKICFICQTTHRWLSNLPNDQFEPFDNGDSKPYFFSVPLNYASSETPQPWIIRIQGLPTLDLHTHKPIRWPSVAFELYLCGNSSDRPHEGSQPHQLDTKISRDLYSRLGTHRNHYSGSQDAIDLALSWSTQCAQSHTQCSRRKQEYELPTRVIYVGLGGNKPSDFQDLRLILANGLRGHYASLSHRWSSITKQFCTTQNNFQQNMKYISLERLPRTFRDSIILCRQLGIRYLWIDCLCIIQDDDKDWQKECEKMADIFENSYLTISALRARDGDGGLFHLREQDNRQTYLRAQGGTLIGIREREHGLEEDMRISSMASRGWILQEKILSRALLHFGDRQIHWECQNATIAEIRATMQVSGSGPLKNILHEAQRQGCHLYPQGHFTAWSIIIQHYSNMDLTLEYDRLPAMLGLAKRFQQSFRATFAAGLWLEDLHRGLLWSRYGKGKDNISTSQEGEQNHDSKHSKVLAKCLTAPSWSWITTASDSRIRFEWDEDFPSPYHVFPTIRLWSETDAEVVDVSVTSCPEIHRGAVEGTIRLWGIIIKTKVFPSPMGKFWSTIQRMRHRVNGKRQHLHPRVSHCPLVSSIDNFKTSEVCCVLDFDFSEPLECYCLAIADWRFEDSYRGFFGRPHCNSSPELRCFLVLRRARRRRKHRHPLDYGVFERIGMGAGDISTVTQFFGQSHEKKFITIV